MIVSALLWSHFLCCKNGSITVKCFKLQCISAWVKKKHSSLFAYLSFKADIGFNDKFDVVRFKIIGQFFPLLHFKNNAPVQNRNIFTVNCTAFNLASSSSIVAITLFRVICSGVSTGFCQAGQGSDRASISR